jgi:His-Xaa-Ser system radical SAM maturase HxsC
MIPLRAKGRASVNLPTSIVGRVTLAGVAPKARPDHVFVGRRNQSAADLSGYAGLCDGGDDVTDIPAGMPAVIGVSTDHLRDGDIVALDPTGQVRTLFRKEARSHFLFATDRCNSYCLMCSQPPRQVDDRWRVGEMLRVLELIDPATPELGITGGEPTLLGDDFILLLEACRDRLPRTALHILSNGRLLRTPLAQRIASVGHGDLMLGVPLYSDLDWHHDHVVQAKGAFDETMLGLQNLGRFGVPVEIRVVLHRLTVPRLGALAEFIYRNLTFASQVALMGLEPVGLALPNMSQLWMDPVDYAAELEKATLHLAKRGVKVMIYNHQLCTVPEAVWPFCRQSISEWKNEYLRVCDGCTMRSRCGGFFSSAIGGQHSRGIQPILSPAP